MAWTTPRTWVTNETVTAAIMNTHVRDNLDDLNDRAGEFAILTSGTNDGSLTASTWEDRSLTAIRQTWDGSTIGTSISWLSLASNEFTLDAGTYWFTGVVTVAVDNDQYAARIVRSSDSAEQTRSLTEFTSTSAGVTGQYGCRLIPQLVVVASSTAYKVQSYAVDPANNWVGIGSDLYTMIQITKVA